MNHHKTQLKTQENEENESVCLHVAFFLSPVLIYMIFIILLIGAQDILAGTEIQTSTVLLADIAPYTLVPLVFPLFAKRVPYLVRFIIVVICELTAFLSLGLVHNVYWNLAAVSLASLGAAVADTSIAGLTSYFKPSALSWYSTGTGVGLLIAPLYYTGMTTWLCVSSRTTFLILGPCSMILLLFYYFIQREITKDELKPSLTTRKEVPYSKLEALDSEDEDDAPQKDVHTFASKDVLTWKEKFSAFKKLLDLVLGPLSIAFASEYLFYQSVITTIAYPSSPFAPRDHYQYYSLALMIGEVLGRSNRSILGIVKPSWLYRPTSLLLWVLATLEFSHLLLFFFESWFRFFPGVGALIFFCFTGGVVIGLIYSNGLEILRASFEGNEREFVLTMALFAPNCGTLISSFIGLVVEPALFNHCISYVKNTEYCFTRPANLKSVIASCIKRM